MKKRALCFVIALALMIGMTLSLAVPSPAIASTASGRVTPNAALNDGDSVLNFEWEIRSWNGIAAYYTFSVYPFGQDGPFFIQYSDGAGVDDFPGMDVPLQDVAGTVGAPDVYLRHPEYDPEDDELLHEWRVPAGLATGRYTAQVQLYLFDEDDPDQPETYPVGSASMSFIVRDVNARISIVESATKRVGDSHDFTVTVEKNAGEGEGWVPAAGVSVTPGHSGVGSITSNPPYTTDALGQVTVTVNSAVPGVATIHASATVTIGSAHIGVTTDGAGAHVVDNQKTWVSDGAPVDPEPRSISGPALLAILIALGVAIAAGTVMFARRYRESA